MILRRRPHHPELGRFLQIAEHVDRAQRALLLAIPTPRDDGAPLAEALHAFDGHLQVAGDALNAWSADNVADLRERCAQAIADAGEESSRLRAQTEPLSFEMLNARVGDVLHPLETLADIERDLRGMRRNG